MKFLSMLFLFMVVDASAQMDRTILPIREPKTKVITEMDARKAVAPPRFEVKAPKKAPNVVIVLIDDFGFGQSNTFGGPINMPTLQSLADNGIKYNRFHTTALCSPTRVSILTGHNHHANNAGAIMEMATAFPGNTGVRPQTITPLAEILRQNGFNTAAFGKYHETPPWEISVSGPFERWPTHSGFEKFYGFIGGETNQWAPALYEGTARVEIPKDPNYHLTNDLADKAVSWVKAQQSLSPDKPFFLYFATGATHAPHHAPKEWIEKYKGKFDQGWDKLREETIARQKEMGVVPQNTNLTARPESITAWDSFSSEERKLLARQMETFAGFAGHTDQQVGRIVNALKEMDELDNTLFFYIAGDNGASAEGGPAGAFNEILALNGISNTMEMNAPYLEQWGSPRTFPHYSIGWAHAGNTPFQWTKQVASHFGGTRNGMVVHWPEKIKNTKQVRSQFHHVNDIAPTVLAATDIPIPKVVNGVKQRPMDGVSMLYSFDNPTAKDRKETQYFEMFGNRAIYHKGWVAATRHSIPWQLSANPTPLKDDVWELYNVNDDFSQSNNLSKKFPGKLKELQAVFEKEALRNNVYPIDDRRSERFNASIAGRPELIGTRKSIDLFEGMIGINENAFLNIKNKSYRIVSEVELPQDKTNGVIICQAGRFGGWSLFMKDGVAYHEYNYFGAERTKVSSAIPLSKGKHTIRYEFKFNGGKPGSGGESTLFVDNQKTETKDISKTMPFMLSGDEGIDVGMDNETTASDDYEEGNNKFGGKITKISVQTDEPSPNFKEAQEEKSKFNY